MRLWRVGVMAAATVMVVAPVVSAAAAGTDVPASYTLRATAVASYTTVDKCCSIIITRLVEGGTAYVGGAMTLQRHLVTAAPEWPGELVATSPGTVGFASGGAVPLPDLPGYARASTPGNSDDATEIPASGSVSAGSATVHSDSRAQRANAYLASVTSGTDGLRAETSLAQSLTKSSGTGTVTASVADLSIAGVVHIGSVTVRATASSGTKGRTSIAVANCSVGPVPCSIDADGVHLQDAPPASLSQAQAALDGLSAAGTKIVVAGGYTNTETAIANGVLVEHTLADPTGDTETTRTVYGFASVSSAARAQAAAPLIGIGTSTAGGDAATANEPGAASTESGGAAEGTKSGGAATAEIAPTLAPDATPGLPATSQPRILARTRYALVSRLSSGSVAWMGFGVLLWVVAVMGRWVLPNGPRARQG